MHSSTISLLSVVGVILVDSVIVLSCAVLNIFSTEAIAHRRVQLEDSDLRDTILAWAYVTGDANFFFSYCT